MACDRTWTGPRLRPPSPTERNKIRRRTAVASSHTTTRPARGVHREPHVVGHRSGRDVHAPRRAEALAVGGDGEQHVAGDPPRALRVPDRVEPAAPSVATWPPRCGHAVIFQPIGVHAGGRREACARRRARVARRPCRGCHPGRPCARAPQRGSPGPADTRRGSRRTCRRRAAPPARRGLRARSRRATQVAVRARRRRGCRSTRRARCRRASRRDPRTSARSAGRR